MSVTQMPCIALFTGKLGGSIGLICIKDVLGTHGLCICAMTFDLVPGVKVKSKFTESGWYVAAKLGKIGGSLVVYMNKN